MSVTRIDTSPREQFMVRPGFLPLSSEPISARAGGFAPSPPSALVEISEQTTGTPTPRISTSMSHAMITSKAHVPTKFALEYAIALNSEFSSDLSPSAGATSSSENASPTLRGMLEASDDYLDITIVATSISKATLLEAEIAVRLDNLAWGEDLHYQWDRAEVSTSKMMLRNLHHTSFTND
jgi:hypothetical protein